MTMVEVIPEKRATTTPSFYVSLTNLTTLHVFHKTKINNNSSDKNQTYACPENIVFVFWARVHDAQQIVSSPVTLTVGEDTELSMNVDLGEGFDHVVSGRLLCGGAGVAGKQVVVKVNGTAVDVVETSDDGSYSSTLNLEPVDNKLTNYQIEAVFYGDDALNLTGLATLPNGTEYAVCTTFRYFGYKPSSNAAWLTVEPRIVDV